MAVKLRLMRMGKKKQPTYRVVAADARSPRNGRFIEIIGTYEPRQDPSVIKIDNERAVHWLSHGAQPTERVEKLLRISGAWTEHTGEAVDAVVPETKTRKSARQQAKEEAAADESASTAAAADVSSDESASTAAAADVSSDESAEGSAGNGGDSDVSSDESSEGSAGNSGEKEAEQ
jgi:small subunit ribosomal protein S16